MSEEFVQILDDAPARGDERAGAWTVLVVDDDEAVHEGTRFALFDYELDGLGLEILSAYSAREGKEILAARPDIAVVLLDVVMESDDAGLALVDDIRRELGNRTVRIILRTGQPGQAPERAVIVEYDINDYKAKTELTADKLFTAITAALRSFRQLERLEATRRGLEIIVDAASMLFDLRSVRKLAQGVLTQIATLLGVDCAGILVLRESARGEDLAVLAGSGCYGDHEGALASALSEDLRTCVREALERRGHAFEGARSVLYSRTGSGREVVVVIESPRPLSETDRALVELFSSRLSVAFDNVLLHEELQGTNARLEERVVARTAELIRANRRLASQRADLRRANQLKTEILGTVAHDLKNPLAVILGRAEMLDDLIGVAPPPLDTMRTQVRHIRETAEQLSDMVSTLVADAMNDALDITIRREPMDLSALVREVIEANRPLAERKHQAIALEAPEPVPALADQDRLREAIENLVSNAVKYSPVGAPIVVGVHARAGSAVVAVRDEGPGLMPEDVARVFGRFQRLSAKPTAGETSTGLGLSIVRRIAELHGGEATAASPGPGRGSTFEIRIPLAEGRETA
ncbi:ATP-binding response regulator [Salinarimonas sp. NSM]|uniref:ATP-binding response regulator n=1 Tax=Salinarimonas sp. NSM TaxID=3458003 RepID=UPI0040365B72